MFERAAAQPALLFGKSRAQHPQILRQRGPDRRVAALVAGDEALPGLEPIGIGQETRQRIADHVLRVGIGEILSINSPMSPSFPRKPKYRCLKAEIPAFVGMKSIIRSKTEWKITRLHSSS